MTDDRQSDSVGLVQSHMHAVRNSIVYTTLVLERGIPVKGF